MEIMEQIHIDTLKKFKKEIVDDIDVDNQIIKSLKSAYILKDEDIIEISNGKSKVEKASILLNLLPRCGPFAFEEFSKSLQQHYYWLSDFMETDLKRSGMLNCDMNHINDLPPCPPLSVTRQEKVLAFKQKLNKLKPGEYFALHGLKGIGKSCLTVMTLKDTYLVANLFQNEIYWIKFSYSDKRLERQALVDEKKVDEEILIQLNALYQRIKKSDAIPTPLKSETLKECLIRLIKMHFCDRQHQNALLILDDVYHKNIVDAFHFQCKILIITDDFSVVKHKHPLTYEIADGFKESETLSLFAKVLDIPVEKLPPEAKEMHERCKGMPLLINLFAAQFEDFKEQMIAGRARWKYYLRCLEERDSKNRAIQIQQAMFDICIEKLRPDLKKQFYEFSIFNEDINIMPKTLEILWGLEPIEVDDLMLIFCQKSLASRKWSIELKCYIYGIHDLILTHLRRKQTQPNMQQKHQTFIEKYLNACDNNYSKFPDDNYCYSYIGHHLEQSGLYHLYQKMYLDLEFIQEKIKKAGLYDLLIDLEKYKDFITEANSEDLLYKLEDLKKFLNHQIVNISKYVNRNCLDIIQLALNYAEDGFVMDQARKIAFKQSRSLYLSPMRDSSQSTEIIPSESTIDPFMDDVSIICCTDDPNSLLIATKNGEIIKKNSLTKNNSYFCGLQKQMIIKLQLSNSGNHFLALSKDGIAKLFFLKDYENNNKINKSPRSKQIFHTGIFSNADIKDDSLQTFCVKSDSISDIDFYPNDELIAGCTLKGIVQVWNINGEEVAQTKIMTNYCLGKIMISRDLNKNMLLHVVDQKKYALSIYKLNTKNLEYKTTFNPQLVKENEETKLIFFGKLPEKQNSLILVTENKVAHINWHQLPGSDQLHSFSVVGQSTIDDPSSMFVCATVTYDGHYLITAKSNGYVNILDIHNRFTAIAFYKGYISSLDTYWNKNQEHHLICGNENKLIYKWKLEHQTEKRKSLNKPLFNALMKPLGKNDMVARRTEKLVVSQGTKSAWNKIAETHVIEGSVQTMLFTPDETKIIYDIVKEQQQEIFYFDITTNKSQRIMHLRKPSNFIKIVTNFEAGIPIIIQENNTLRVWQESKVCYVVPDIGNVISVHEMDKNRLLTVTTDFVIVHWDVSGSDWQRLYIQNFCSANSRANNSILSNGKSFLAVLNKNQYNIVLYKITKDLKVDPVHTSVNVYYEISKPNDQISCLEFSKDEKYLAIGFYNGDISIFSMEEKKEIQQLNFHSNPVKQLHWAPSSIITSILLSTDSEDLVWWKIAPIKKQSNTLIDFTGITSEIDDSLRNFWKNKSVKKEESALMGLVPLPLSNAKVCVSEDFNKFLTIDANGCIITFKPFQTS